MHASHTTMQSQCRENNKYVFLLLLVENCWSQIQFSSSDSALVAFSDLTPLVGRQEGHPACKKSGDGGGGHWLVWMEWRLAGWSVCLPLLVFPCTIKSEVVFWDRLNRVVPEKKRHKTLVVWWWRLWVKVLRLTQYKIGHFVDVLPIQSLGLVLSMMLDAPFNSMVKVLTTSVMGDEINEKRQRCEFLKNYFSTCNAVTAKSQLEWYAILAHFTQKSNKIHMFKTFVASKMAWNSSKPSHSKTTTQIWYKHRLDMFSSFGSAC